MPQDDSVLIPLRARDGSIRAYAIVDAADAAWVNQWRWCLSDGYVHRNAGGGKHVKLHRELLGLTRGDGVEVDHENRNKLDNRRGNLRRATHAGNMQNHPGYGGSSKYRGVTWNKKLNKWVASIRAYGKQTHIGVFVSEDEAGAAARRARETLMPLAVD
jgi:hypothetical protein